mgnify:FL=1
MSEEITNNNNREYLGSVDIVRFLMALLIMSHHLYLLGYKDDWRGISCWIWVDYFFMLTGYFSIRHFAAVQEKPVKCAGYEAVKYTVHKFKKLVPYIAIAVFVQYLMIAVSYMKQYNLRGILDAFSNMPYEILLLSSSGIVKPEVAPIWYLSAMFLALPLLIYMLLRFEDLWYILAWLVPVLYYGRMGVNTIRDWPNDLVRAFSCMALGTFVFILTSKVKELKFSVLQRVLLTVVEIGLFGLCILITVANKPYMKWPYMNLLPLLFVVHATIMLSGCSYSAKAKGVFCQFWGEISLPMFLFQWGIGTFTAAKITAVNGIRLCIYYLGTILASVMVIVLKKMISRQRREDGLFVK